MKARWDKLYKAVGMNFTSPIWQIELAAKEIGRGNKAVLDLGCGTGLHSIELAKKGYRVFGVDISEEAICIAKSFSEAKKYNIEFSVSNMNRLPYNNELFDGIVCLRTLNHGRIGSIKKTINEICRVLKPGGKVFVSVQKLYGNKKKLGISKFNNLPVELIEPYTYRPLEGKEKGIIHFSFNKTSLKEVFSDFSDIKISLQCGREKWERYYFLTATKC